MRHNAPVAQLGENERFQSDSFERSLNDNDLRSLAGLDASESLEEKACVEAAMKYGRQAYLQRRISSEASIGKILFQNGYQMLQHRGLTEGGKEDIAFRRTAAAQDLRELAQRLERIRGRVMGRRSSK